MKLAWGTELRASHMALIMDPVWIKEAVGATSSATSSSMAVVIARVSLKSLFNLVGLINSTLWKFVTLLMGTHMNAGIGNKIAQGALPELQKALNTQRLEVQFKLIVVALVGRKKNGGWYKLVWLWMWNLVLVLFGQMFQKFSCP